MEKGFVIFFVNCLMENRNFLCEVMDRIKFVIEISLKKITKNLQIEVNNIIWN